jgi:hypothetical protein
VKWWFVGSVECGQGCVDTCDVMFRVSALFSSVVVVPAVITPGQYGICVSVP